MWDKGSTVQIRSVITDTIVRIYKRNGKQLLQDTVLQNILKK